MKKKFTPLSISKFIYNELSESEKKSFKAAIIHNDMLKKEYFEHRALKTELDNIRFSPSEKSMAAILKAIENNQQTVLS